MKKLWIKTAVLIAVLSGLTALSASAENAISELTFNDPALASCIADTAAENGWTTVAQFVSLKCHSMDIKKAQDVTQLSAIKSLSLYNNQISQLDLTELTQLEELNLAGNQLIQLQIRGLNQLETLYLFRNKLTTVDLTGLSKVHTVRLMQNTLETLDITPLISLQKGYFFDNQLEDLQITGLSQLEFMDVRQNPMPDELYDFYDEQDGMVISHDGNADDWK